MREYLENHPMVETSPLDPRDAFFGSRTGNIVTRYEVTGTEKIRYVDVCSLVLPPRDLFHPVLPYRVQGKLLFALCRSCCETFSQVPCTHDDAREREFEGTWVTCELRKANGKGYLVTAVSEIWQYKVSQFDHTTRQGGLFTEYINTFLQLKQEASGWPCECGENDDDAKERYLREYEKTEDIVLDKRNVTRNPGLRSVAKLCLNSFWGKFGQRSNLPNTEVVRTPQRFATLMMSAEHEITGILPVNDEVIYLSWRLRQDAVIPSPITNVVIVAYTTAQTPVTRTYEPRTGNFLGDMTDELESYGRGSYIETFVSGALNFIRTLFVHRTDEHTNAANIRNLMLAKERVGENEENEEESAGTSINLRFRAIWRTVFHELVTRYETEVCAPVLMKRKFINSHCSLPYGYVAER
ncbi:uncharacterized protein [Polyergus mexicanus]|uniref:uncharacterized protein n=1 Tax=Polyergus mexicanus TaxID=615972 RepID=UPI0038B5A08C